MKFETFVFSNCWIAGFVLSWVFWARRWYKVSRTCDFELFSGSAGDALGELFADVSPCLAMYCCASSSISCKIEVCTETGLLTLREFVVLLVRGE